MNGRDTSFMPDFKAEFIIRDVHTLGNPDLMESILGAALKSEMS